MGDSSVSMDEQKPKLAFQSKDLEELLDVIDNLRLQGIARFIDLPQLIVCGDQSSGKSSVLEAVSGVKFPTKDNLCTRHPTELILRRKNEVTTTITIVPDATRTEQEKQTLQAFKAGAEALDDFGATVDTAGKLMGLEGNVKNFCTDVLRVELTGPTLPHLTLVDLPGLFHSGSKAQSDEDAETVKELVTGYMERARSVILAVVSAKNDYGNQIVTRHARDVDPRGERTLGIITKPDQLHEGSSSEQQYLDLAQNNDVVLRLGWHVLRNRDYTTRDCSNEDRDRDEAEFFAKGVWTSMSPSQLGIGSLKPRLSRILRDQILTELPNLTKDVESGIKDCENRLDRLGASRSNKAEQRVYLHKVSQDFHQIVQSSVEGHYMNQYFEDSSSKSYSKRIRAVTTNLLDEFAETMRTKGHQYQIVEGELPANDEDDDVEMDESGVRSPIKVTRETRLKRVAELLRENRGRELPGFTKFEIVTTLFREQSQLWEHWIKYYTDEIFEGARSATHLALDHFSDQQTKDGILRFIVNPVLDDIKADLDARVAQNLQQHIQGHPITFNHYFTENVQKLRNAHEAQFLEAKLTSFFNLGGTGYFDENRSTTIKRQFTIENLVEKLTSDTEADMNKFACSEALHYMEAYYKVALKFLVDDFSIHTVEQGLLEKLEGIFNPSTVLALSDEEIESIADENEESRSERASSLSKSVALKKALKLLRQLDRGRPKRMLRNGKVS